MAADTNANKATNDDRFEVLQNSIEELKALVLKSHASLETRLETQEKRVAGLSAQSSIDVMGLKVEEPHTKQNMTTLRPDGWDTSERQKAITEANKSDVVVNNAPVDVATIATAVAMALKQSGNARA